MKRLTILAAICVLFGTMILGTWAAETPLTMTNVQANPGDTIQIAVSLQESVKGDAIGISYSYDSAKLKVLPEQCGWSRKGVLQDFSARGDGVWAVSDPVDVKGEVCILVFQVPENASFTETEVSCTLVIRNGAREVGSYQAAALVSRQCSHSFGQWSDSGEIGHSRSCSLCKTQQTQSHSWTESPITRDPDNGSTGIKTSTCDICAATRTEHIANYFPGRPATEPTDALPEEMVPEPTGERPQPTYPEEREEEPLEEISQPAEPSGTEPTRLPQSGQQQKPAEPENAYTPSDYNRSPEETKASEAVPGNPVQEHGHEHPDAETVPLAIPIVGWTGDPETEAAAAEPETHDHTREMPGNSVAIAFVVITAALAATGAFLYRKAKRR